MASYSARWNAASSRAAASASPPPPPAAHSARARIAGHCHVPVGGSGGGVSAQLPYVSSWKAKRGRSSSSAPGGRSSLAAGKHVTIPSWPWRTLTCESLHGVHFGEPCA